MDGYPGSVKVMAAMLTVGPTMAALGAVFFAGTQSPVNMKVRPDFCSLQIPIKRETLWVGQIPGRFSSL